MIKTFLYLSTFAVLLFPFTQKENEISKWRGADGIYHESGLLKEWPAEGPELEWFFEGLGYGHSSAVVTANNVFVTGMKDTVVSVGTLFSFDRKGNLLWKKDYGPEFNLNFHGTRSTPTLVGDFIYVESGMGAVYCLNTKNGEKIWSVDFIKDLGVDSVVQFGYAESVLIDGDNLYCVPGGKTNNVVALNRFTGKMVWSSKGHEEQATYNSPILINQNGQKLVIAMTAASVMGIDAGTGEMYWRVEQTQQNKIHANTPVFDNGKLLVASAGREKTSGMVLYELSPDGKNVTEVWRNNKFINLMGGQIKLDSCIYSSAYLKNDWQILSWNTGEMIHQNKDMGGGSIIFSDGLFYGYSERDGEIFLMKASPAEMEIISKFKVPFGTNEHWAHPVINFGQLFVRHSDALMVYNISGK